MIVRMSGNEAVPKAELSDEHNIANSKTVVGFCKDAFFSGSQFCWYSYCCQMALYFIVGFTSKD